MFAHFGEWLTSLNDDRRRKFGNFDQDRSGSLDFSELTKAVALYLEENPSMLHELRKAKALQDVCKTQTVMDEHEFARFAKDWGFSSQLRGGAQAGLHRDEIRAIFEEANRDATYSDENRLAASFPEFQLAVRALIDAVLEATGCGDVTVPEQVAGSPSQEERGVYKEAALVEMMRRGVPGGVSSLWEIIYTKIEIERSWDHPRGGSTPGHEEQEEEQEHAPPPFEGDPSSSPPSSMPDNPLDDDKEQEELCASQPLLAAGSMALSRDPEDKLAKRREATTAVARYNAAQRHNAQYNSAKDRRKKACLEAAGAQSRDANQANPVERQQHLVAAREGSPASSVALPRPEETRETALKRIHSGYSKRNTTVGFQSRAFSDSFRNAVLMDVTEFVAFAHDQGFFSQGLLQVAQVKAVFERMNRREAGGDENRVGATLEEFKIGLGLLLERALFYASCADLPMEEHAVSQPGEVEVAGMKQTMTRMGLPPGVVALWELLYTPFKLHPKQQRPQEGGTGEPATAVAPVSTPVQQQQQQRISQPTGAKSPRTKRREATIAAARRNAVKRHNDQYNSAKDRKKAAELKAALKATVACPP